MTSTIKLKQGDSGTELDLNVGLSSKDAAVGWNVEDWLVKEAEYMEGEKPPLVTETMDLLLKGSDHDDLAERKQSMHAMQFASTRYVTQSYYMTPVWLHVKTCGETNERRALVHEIKLESRSPAFDTKGWADQNIVRYRATIIREPFWESTTTTTLATHSSATGPAFLYDYYTTGTPLGDVPMRLEYISFSPNAAGSLGRIWAGVRSDHFSAGGDASKFEPLWELEDGTIEGNLNDITTQTSVPGGDSEASPISGANPDYIRVRPNEVDFDVDDFYLVSSIQLGDVAPDYPDDNCGTMLVLLIAAVSAQETYWEVKLKYGYESMPDADRPETEIKEINSVEWEAYEMGIIPVPSRKIQVLPSLFDGGEKEEKFEIQIWARRTATGGGGNNDLELDCFCMVPLDEGYLKVWDSTAVGSHKIYFGEAPHGITDCVTWDNSSSRWGEFNAYSVQNFRFTPGDGRLVIAFARANQWDPQVTLDIAAEVFERWVSLRGTE